jgi:OTU domain-containing protein 6
VSAAVDSSSPLERAVASHEQALADLRAATVAEAGKVGKKNRKKKKAVWTAHAEKETALKREQAAELLALGFEDDAEAVATARAAWRAAHPAETPPAPGSTAANTTTAAHGTASGGKKLTRAQKKRAKAKARAAELEAERAQIRAGAVDLRADESARLLHRLPKEFCIKDVPSDGHCLFRAVDDQLSRLGPRAGAQPAAGTVPAEAGFRRLRRLAADYLRAHETDFAPFFLADAEAGGKGATAGRGYAGYCDAVETSAEWAGQLELRALSSALRRRIEVFSADAPVLVLGASEAGDPIRLSFHRHYFALGEHYNSIVPRGGTAA